MTDKSPPSDGSVLPETIAHRVMTSEQWIDEEILRARVRNALERQSASRFERLSRHPLAPIIIGFLLTWLLGTLLTDHWKQAQLRNQARLEQERARREVNLGAIERLSNLIYSRRTAAELLASALRQRWPEADLRARKALYDSAYVRWNEQIQSTNFVIRGIEGEYTNSPLEGYVQYGLIPHFTRIDQLLTTAYTARITRTETSNQADFAIISAELTATIHCAYEITQALWLRINTPTEPSPSRFAALWSHFKRPPEASSSWRAARAASDSTLNTRCPRQRS